MAIRVPSYERQVGTQALSMPAMQAERLPERTAAGAVADGIGDLAGVIYEQASQKEAADLDTAFEDGLHGLLRGRGEEGAAPGFLARSGDDAFQASGLAIEDLEKLKTDLLGSASTPRSRAIFEKQIEGRVRAAHDKIESHAFNQRQVAIEASLVAREGAAERAAADDYTNAGTHLEALRETTDSLTGGGALAEARRREQAAKVGEAALLGAMNREVGGTVVGGVRTGGVKAPDVLAARAIHAQFREFWTPQRAAALEADIDGAGRVVEADSSVQTIAAAAEGEDGIFDAKKFDADVEAKTAQIADPYLRDEVLVRAAKAKIARLSAEKSEEGELFGELELEAASGKLNPKGSQFQRLTRLNRALGLNRDSDLVAKNRAMQEHFTDRARQRKADTAAEKDLKIRYQIGVTAALDTAIRTGEVVSVSEYDAKTAEIMKDLGITFDDLPAAASEVIKNKGVKAGIQTLNAAEAKAERERKRAAYESNQGKKDETYFVTRAVNMGAASYGKSKTKKANFQSAAYTVIETWKARNDGEMPSPAQEIDLIARLRGKKTKWSGDSYGYELVNENGADALLQVNDYNAVGLMPAVPAAAVERPAADFDGRVKQLRAQGLSDEQVAARLHAEGFR
jgi:hypothetical protein